MRIYYFLILGFSLGSCFPSTDKKLEGQWRCYKVFSSPNETIIDTLVNREIFEFKKDYTYEQRRWKITGHGTWSLAKHKDQQYTVLTMISDQGFADKYLIEKLNNKELVLVSIYTVSGETIRNELFCERLETRQISSAIDSLNYDKEDYDLMREFFSSDSVFVKTLNERVELGDTNSIKVKRLLQASFESKDNVGLTDLEIETLIRSYKASKEVSEKFRAIKNSLPKTDANAIRGKTDSLVNSLERLKKELKSN